MSGKSTDGLARLSRRVGLGFRPELASDLLLEPNSVDFVEVVAETCFSQKATYDEALALSRVWPVVPHGVKLSLGSAAGIDETRAARLGALARSLDAPVVSEHVSFSRGGELEIGHLTQLPRTREAVRVVARNVATLRRHLPDVPLLLENVAWSLAWPDDEMDEATFYQEIVAATGCPLLLDVGNLYANAVNERRDPREVLAAYPLGAVAMLHVAGGIVEDGFYFDTHAHPVPSAVLDLVSTVLLERPDLPVLLERDAGFESFASLRAELDMFRSFRPARRDSIPRSWPRDPAHDDPFDASRLASAQADVAALLVAPSSSRPPALVERFGASAIARARGILERKRVDDALPLLGRLARRAVEIRALAEHAMVHHPRAPRGAGPADALVIAEVAARAESLRDDALVDRLMLRARFTAPDPKGCVAPRVGPFVGAELLTSGIRICAVKGFGAFAPVRLFERKARSWKADYRTSLPW